MPRRRKSKALSQPTVENKSSLGPAPTMLAKQRPDEDRRKWCVKIDPTEKLYDKACDEYNPRAVNYKDVCKAHRYLSKHVAPTTITKSNLSSDFEMELYYKMESSHNTGSFHERGAIYVLHMLSDQQREGGIYTASNGNWGYALAFHGSKLGVHVTVVMNVITAVDLVHKCQNCGATVILHGNNLNEARKKALIMIHERGTGTYINGYDHPNVIAAAGTIAIEILKDLPTVNAILVPVGGGGLIAGIATVVKRLRPDVKIYGIEPNQSCCFFKALVNERPYPVAAEMSTATSLTVPTAGYNAFHTARSLIDKMVLVQDASIARAVLHMLEDDKLVCEGAGAMGLAAILSSPELVPELIKKKVVTIVSGANINSINLSQIVLRAKIAEEKIIIVSVYCGDDQTRELSKILKIFASLKCNVLDEVKHRDEDATSDSLYNNTTQFLLEVSDWKRACLVKRVIEKLYGDKIKFGGDPYERGHMCKCIKTSTWSNL